MNIYVSRDGQNFGPYTTEHAHGMLQSGELVPNDLACPEGASEWAPLAQVLNLPAQAAPLTAAQVAVPIAQPATAVPPPGYTGPAPGYPAQQQAPQPGYQAGSPMSAAPMVALPPGVAPGSPSAAMVVRQMYGRAASAWRGVSLCAAAFVFSLGLIVLAIIVETGDLLAMKPDAFILAPFKILTFIGSIVVGALGAVLFAWLFVRGRKKAQQAKAEFYGLKRSAGF